MSYLTLLVMAMGVVVSAVSGLVCYMGQVPSFVNLEWLPCGNLLTGYPQASLGVGGVIVFMGILCQPTRVD